MLAAAPPAGPRATTATAPAVGRAALASAESALAPAATSALGCVAASAASPGPLPASETGMLTASRSALHAPHMAATTASTRQQSPKISNSVTSEHARVAPMPLMRAASQSDHKIRSIRLVLHHVLRSSSWRADCRSPSQHRCSSVDPSMRLGTPLRAAELCARQAAMGRQRRQVVAEQPAVQTREPRKACATLASQP